MLKNAEQTGDSLEIREQTGRSQLVRIAPQTEPQGSTHFIHPCGTKLSHASS
jgi:hypothetical protein